MTEHSKDFQQEQLDQQIEQPARYLDTKARHLVEDLQQMYHTQSDDKRANEESLRRVRRLLESRLQPSHQETNILEFAEVREHHERKTMMIDNAPQYEAASPRKKDLASQRKPRWHRISRLFNTIAAVLVVAVLVGSAALLLNARRNANPETTTGSHHVSNQPQVKLDCTPIFASGFGSTDDGEHSVCAQGKEMPLQQSDTINNHKLTLISTYADANRLLIKYSVSGKISQRYDGGASISKLAIQAGNQTHELQNGGGSFGSYYDQKNNQTIFLDSYITPQDMVNAKELQITATFLAVGGATSDDPTGTSFPTTFFNFTVPMQSTKRVATLNQSLVINGHHLTLTQVSVTASATYLYLKPEDSLRVPHEETVSATVNESKAFVSELNEGKTAGKGDPLTSWTITVVENWLDKPANWTLKLQSTGTPLGVGSGEIQFTVPPVSK